jgi:aminoglycoside phosphotransferase (APT) family kinase protein
MAIDKQIAFSGTKDVSTHLRFETARLVDFLERNIKGFAGPITVSQFRGGQSNPTYLVSSPTARYVLRRKPPGSLLPSAHAVDREFRVIRALHARGFPVPKPVVYCDDNNVIGTAFYIMAFVSGRTFWEPAMPGSNPSERAGVYDGMNKVLAQLHSFEPADLGLQDFGKGENYVGRQVKRWSAQYRASQTEDIEDMERLIAWLPEHIPPSGPVRVVHGDYRLDNLIVEIDGTDVISVIDWELSTLGDPLADFSYHIMAWFMPETESSAGTATLAGHFLPSLGIPSVDTYIDAYAHRTGFDPRPHLPVYLAYNFFRIAAILQGIIGRVRDGTAASEHAPAKATSIRPLAARAWEFARQAGH